MNIFDQVDKDAYEKEDDDGKSLHLCCHSYTSLWNAVGLSYSNPESQKKIIEGLLIQGFQYIAAHADPEIKNIETIEAILSEKSDYRLEDAKQWLQDMKEGKI